MGLYKFKFKFSGILRRNGEENSEKWMIALWKILLALRIEAWIIASSTESNDVFCVLVLISISFACSYPHVWEGRREKTTSIWKKNVSHEPCYLVARSIQSNHKNCRTNQYVYVYTISIYCIIFAQTDHLWVCGRTRFKCERKETIEFFSALIRFVFCECVRIVLM